MTIPAQSPTEGLQLVCVKTTGLTGLGIFELRVARDSSLNPLSSTHVVDSLAQNHHPFMWLTVWHGIVMPVLIAGPGMVIRLIHDKMSHRVSVSNLRFDLLFCINLINYTLN